MSGLLFFYMIFGKISRFNTSLSIGILPGPDSNRLIEIAINNKSTSYHPSPVKPFPALTMRTAPIISTMKRIDVILVTMPRINKIPPHL